MRRLSAQRRTWCWAVAVSCLGLLEAAALAQDAPPIKRLDGQTKAKVLAALAALVILGFGLVLLVWLGARMTQRYRKSTSHFRATSRPGEHDWARKPLAPKDQDEPGD